MTGKVAPEKIWELPSIGESQEQASADVKRAIGIQDGRRMSPFSDLLTMTAGLFNILRDEIGWTDEKIRRFYPEQTIVSAIKQGWKPKPAAKKGRAS